MNTDANWGVSDLSLADGMLEHIVLKTKFTEFQEACRPSDVVVPSSMIDLLDVALGRVSAFVSGEDSSNDAL